MDNAQNRIQFIDLTPDISEAKRTELKASTYQASFNTSFLINGCKYYLNFRGLTVATFKKAQSIQEYKIKFS